MFNTNTIGAVIIALLAYDLIVRPLVRTVLPTA